MKICFYVSKIEFQEFFASHHVVQLRPWPRVYILDIRYVFAGNIHQYYTSVHLNIDGFVHDCSTSSALAMELLQSCTKPSIYLSNEKMVTN